MSLHFRGIAGLLVLSGGLWSQPTFQITTATPLPNGNVGVPYALQLTATPGFSTPYSWTTFSSPPGLTLSSSGLISGTPTTMGPYFLRTSVVTAQGSNGPTANKTLSLTIDLAPLTITTPDPLNSGTINSRYSQIVTATGGLTPYAWSATSLPAGLFISASNGLLAGTPTQAGNFTVPVTVVDSAKPQNSATVSFTLVISSGLKINTTIISDPMVGVAYTQSLTANGGTTPYSWSISGGFLPAGLSINGTTGTIGGTASVAGAYNFTVKVTDAQQSSATQTFMGTVTTPINFLTPALANGVVGTPYSQQINATGGTPPLSFTLAANPFGTSTLPPGLKLSSTGGITGTPATAGTYSTITVIATDSLANTATKTYTIIITAVQAALQVSPSTLTFSGSATGDAPPPQLVTVLGAGTTPAAFTVTLDGGQANTPAPSWLIVTPLTGNTPGVLTVVADPSGLNAGSFNARVLVNGVPVAVSLTVAAAPPNLSVAPTFLRYAARVQSPGLLDQVIVVRNAGGGGIQSFSVTAPTPIPWLDSITPNSGQTSPNNPVFVRVRINTAGLTVGGYKGVVRFSSPGATIDVPISVFVSAGGPILNVDQTGMRFDMQQGQANGPSDTIQVLNSGDPGTSVNFTASIVNGANWLTVSPNTGTATTTQSASIQLTVTNAQNLAAGGYYALVQIADLKSQNSPQYVVVVLNVSGAGVPVAPVPTPQGLVFTGAGTQPVSVAVSGAATTFTASGVTTDGTSWLSVSPVSGTVSTASPAKVNVTANPAGLKAGVYTGLVNVAAGSQVRGVNVTLIVPAGTGAAASLEAATTTASCTPTRVVLTQTGVVNNFTVPAGWPAALQMAMYDDCANALNIGSVFASFSNGISRSAFTWQRLGCLQPRGNRSTPPET